MGRISGMPRIPVTQLAITIVHYHTAELLAECVAAVRADLSGSGLTGEITVVDNGSEPRDQELLQSLPAKVVSSNANLGYAGGVNCGLASTTAEHLILMNADVLVLPGCLERLAAELTNGAAAAGPTLFWDRGRRFRLPPLGPFGRLEELGRAAANWSTAVERRARASWRRHAWRHWRATKTIKSADLSGALMAVRKDIWQRSGGFDPGFKLYYEEADWLQRVVGNGAFTVFVPSAEAVHLHNQSASQNSRVALWRAASSRLFARRHYGRVFARLVGFLAFAGQRVGSKIVDHIPSLGDGRPELDLKSIRDDVAAVEVADPILGFPAAGQFVGPEPTTSWQLPEDVWHCLASGDYLLQLIDSNGEELRRSSFHRPPPKQAVR